MAPGEHIAQARQVSTAGGPGTLDLDEAARRPLIDQRSHFTQLRVTAELLHGERVLGTPQRAMAADATDHRVARVDRDVEKGRGATVLEAGSTEGAEDAMGAVSSGGTGEVRPPAFRAETRIVHLDPQPRTLVDEGRQHSRRAQR